MDNEVVPGRVSSLGSRLWDLEPRGVTECHLDSTRLSNHAVPLTKHAANIRDHQIGNSSWPELHRGSLDDAV